MSSPAIKKTLSTGHHYAFHERLFLLLQPALLLLSLLVLPFAAPSFPSDATAPVVVPHAAASEEAAALLQWRATLDTHSRTALSSWAPATNPCVVNWTGIACTCTHGIGMYACIVTHISLSYLGLHGTLQNFSFTSFPSLLTLDLTNNRLFGPIPHGVGKLPSLNILALSYNNLSGSIPRSICDLVKLTALYLDDNHLSGSIPTEIGNLTSLNDLNLFNNSLTGPIPTSIGYLNKLTILFLHWNYLSGSIPHELRNLTLLQELRLSYNNLTGPIPISIGYLGKLTILYLGHNKLSSSIPHEFRNLTSLNQLGLNINKLVGSIPTSICYLNNLTKLYLYHNTLSGSIPHQIRNLISLKDLSISNNNLMGSIPTSIGYLHNLNRLYLDGNKLSGSIPHQIGNLRSLNLLLLSDNNFTGKIPPEISEVIQLKVLNFSSNQLKGAIPKELGKLKLLYKLFLDNNRFSCSIPVEIGTLSNLETLNLAANDLNGVVPKQIGDLEKLMFLSFSNNRLTGVIPMDMGKLESLESLDLSQNRFEGLIPPEFSKLKRLEILNISHNQLSGSIPYRFQDLLSLTSIDVSYNKLKGPLPNGKPFWIASLDSYRNNSGLCGNVTGLEACPSRIGEKGNQKLIILITSILSASIFLLLFITVGIRFLVRRGKGDRENPLEEAENGNQTSRNVFTIWRFDGKMVYERILEATEEFHSKYCIGVGGQGSVYKVELTVDQVVAVKKLHGLNDAEMASSRAFEREIHALTEIRHRNIVKLCGFCLHPKHSFLIYEFIERGSLGSILKDEEQAKELDWNKRVNVIKGVASALSYMHHDCTPPIIHRDISINNVLLDLDYEPRVSDFGTAKLLEANPSNWSSIVGTYGYGAPELAYTMKANEKCDVYSFGMVSMEVLMGKHPGDLISSLSSLFSSSTTPSPKEMLLSDIVDERLSSPTSQVATKVFFLFKIAFSCLHTSSQVRPTMKQVSNLLSIENTPLNESFSKISLDKCLE